MLRAHDDLRSHSATTASTQYGWLKSFVTRSRAIVASSAAGSGPGRITLVAPVVVADALPKNPSGKILKRELRSTYAALAAADG